LLKQEISNFLAQNFGPDTYKNLRDAINGLFQKGFLTVHDKEFVREMSLKDDKHVLAAWVTYTVLYDEEELADTLNVLCEVKREKESQLQ
jgi:hypothetical protein